MNVDDEFEVSFECLIITLAGYDEEGTVFLDHYVESQTFRPSCFWRVRGCVPALEAELAVDCVVFEASTYEGLDPEDRGEPFQALSNIPALPPGPHVVSLRITGRSVHEIAKTRGR